MIPPVIITSNVLSLPGALCHMFYECWLKMANLLGGVIHQRGIITVPPTLCQSCRGGLINAEARSQTCTCAAAPCNTSLTVVDAPTAFFLQFVYSVKLQ